ncbi:HD domain-containing protein, partial [Candidatus Woesearchaeota archaeon]|nr:HD domain-containing protein [Candidatus Woesearchaeota archaeon]
MMENQRFRRKKPISDIREGELVDDIFVVKIKRGIQKYAKGWVFTLLLSDQTGSTIEYKFWGPDEEQRVRNLYEAVKQDSVIRVQGKVSDYNNKLQIATNDPLGIQILSPDQYDPSEFIKPPKGDIDKMYNGLKESINYVKNPEIKDLLTSIFTDTDFEEKFKTHPGAIEIHHNWKGGLLQHTIEVLNYCILSHKQFPDLDKDLLIAGALLHDIGKMEELETTTRIKATDKGQLIGHLPMSVIFVEKRINAIPGFDSNLRHKLLHMMASHHGRLEYGSPKEPMIPEAVALYYADEMSAKIAEMTEFVTESRKHTEDSFMFSRRNQ